MIVDLDSHVSVSWSSTPKPEFILIPISSGVYEKVLSKRENIEANVDRKTYVFDVPGCDEATVRCTETEISVVTERMGSKASRQSVDSVRPFDVHSCTAKIIDGSVIIDVRLLPMNQKIMTVKK